VNVCVAATVIVLPAGIVTSAACSVNKWVPVVDMTEIVTTAYRVVPERFLRVAVHVSTPPEPTLTGFRAVTFILIELETTTTVTVVEALGTPGLLPVTVIVYVPVGVCPSIEANDRVALAPVCGVDIVTHAGLTDGLSSFAPLVAKQTLPVKAPRPTTLIVDMPLLSDSRNTRLGVAEILKLFAVPNATLMDTVVVLDNVFGLVPVVPVIVKVKVGGVGTVVQLTVNVVPETLALQPDGAALVENVTVLEKPLIGLGDNVEESVPVPPAGIVTVREAGLADTEKSITWNVTGADCLVCDGLPPTPVTVAV